MIPFRFLSKIWTKTVSFPVRSMLQLRTFQVFSSCDRRKSFDHTGELNSRTKFLLMESTDNLTALNAKEKELF